MSKATLYALTAMPAVADRDINGVYFIRTATGFQINLVANTVGKEVVSMDVVAPPSPIVVKTANYTVLSTDHTIVFSTASANLTCTLPNPSTVPFKILTIVCNTTGAFVVNFSGYYPTGFDAAAIPSLSRGAITIQSDSLGWRRIA